MSEFKVGDYIYWGYQDNIVICKIINIEDGVVAYSMRIDNKLRENKRHITDLIDLNQRSDVDIRLATPTEVILYG